MAASPEPLTRLDRGLRWGLFGTVLIALVVLAVGTAIVYEGAPPIPARAIGPDEAVIYTRDDVVAGKALFQRADLMDFGSLYGNGAYFGPDWTTDYLQREVAAVRDAISQASHGAAYATLSPSAQGEIDAATGRLLAVNRLAGSTLTLTAEQVAAHTAILASYQNLFLNGDARLGLPANTVRSGDEARQLTAFLGWAAWTTVAERPGTGVSYTNAWPYVPGTANQPTDAMWTWSLISLVVLVVGAIAVTWAWRRYLGGRRAALHEPIADATDVDDEAVSPSQLATGKWFLLVPVLLILQGLLGALMAHYYAERTSFFGLDLPAILPFTILKGWHLQSAIAWIAAAWLGAGLFLAPRITAREPRHQRFLVNLLFAAVVLVVGGSLVGMWIGTQRDIGDAWFWVGNQGLEYVQLGRLFQIGLFGGLLLWAVVLLRAFWPGLRQTRAWGGLEALLLYAGAAIGIVYAFGMIPPLGVNDSATITDYWRWWVVHLWVENTFEFFTVVVIGYALLRMGLVARRTVERIVYFELILVFGSGLIGTGHHFYWVGEPAMWMTLGSVFSILEVLPLGLLIIRAWQEQRAISAAGATFPHRAAFAFFVSASVWNFIGAGFIGGVINPPIVSYFEHGTFLTSTHGHASMFGAFGMLALGLIYYCLREMAVGQRWSDRWPLRAAWLFNGAIVMWLAFNLLPVGVAQLEAVIDHGYAFARSLAFYDGVTFFGWLRLPGDLAFLAGGLVVLVDVIVKLRARRAATMFASTPDQLTRGAPRPAAPGVQA
jgi:nitric oxide reductase subunit B